LLVAHQCGLAKDDLNWTTSEETKDRLALFEIFTQDPDPRVRVAALQAFEALHLRARKGSSEGLSKALVQRHCIIPLTDEDINVRLEGLKFIW
jgi:hypothetical protein